MVLAKCRGGIAIRGLGKSRRVRRAAEIQIGRGELDGSRQRFWMGSTQNTVANLLGTLESRRSEGVLPRIARAEALTDGGARVAQVLQIGNPLSRGVTIRRDRHRQ